MIEVKNVSKGFNGKQILTDVSHRFEKGKINLIIGGSGSGKTVLVKCMVGLFEVDKGHIEYDGRDFSNMDFNERKPIRQELGMLFQGSALFDSMTVEQNVMFPLTMLSNMTLAERIERVNVCLNRVNLPSSHKLFPSEISGGMKKRVAIARAIAMNPKYLYCDEPNSGLDPKTSIVIDELIMEITEEYQMVTIINTHDMNSVLTMGENILFIHKGQKWWSGTSEQIFHSGNQELDDFVFASKIMQNLRK
ncbi:MAG TPA: ATP-binding cassette domain-containing protein [Bacteroidia bacterium]|nr:ATP-binding cassette domain-containing protein [Bacteroidia bacterium]